MGGADGVLAGVGVILGVGVVGLGVGVLVPRGVSVARGVGVLVLEPLGVADGVGVFLGGVTLGVAVEGARGVGVALTFCSLISFA